MTANRTLPRRPLDRPVVGVGLLALAAVASTAAPDDLTVVRIRGVGLAVTLVLAALALAAGWFGQRLLALVTGVGFLAAAVLQIVQLDGVAGDVEHGLLDGNASTFSLWLGLGIGLTVLGLTLRGTDRPPSGPPS